MCILSVFATLDATLRMRMHADASPQPSMLYPVGTKVSNACRAQHGLLEVVVVLLKLALSQVTWKLACLGARFLAPETNEPVSRKYGLIWTTWWDALNEATRSPTD
jgi:hypothetical protein